MTNPGDEVGVQPEKLSMTTRWASGGLGICIVGAGIAAVFLKNNNGGSAALIAAGTLFLLMAITGHGIRNVKIGSIDATLGLVEQARIRKRDGDDEGALRVLDTLIETPVIASTPQLSGRIDSLSSVSGVLHTPTTEVGSTSYEQTVYNALTEAVWRRGVLLQDMRTSSRRFDWILRLNQLNIAVEIRSGDKINAQAFAWSMEMIMQTAEIPINGLLVIVNTSAGTSIRDAVEGQLDEVIKSVPKLVVAWQSTDGSTPLVQAVDALLGTNP